MTYTTQQGDYRYYVSKNKDLHGIWLAPADVKAVKDAAVPSYQAGMDLGVKEDGEGIYDVFARDPQSSLTPFLNVVKQNGSTFVYNGSSASKMVQARQEAAIQGVDSVKVWACHQGCYDDAFLETGGADVEGTHSILQHPALLQRVQVERLVEELRQAGRRGRQPQQLRHVGVGRGAVVPGRGREGRRQRGHAHPAVALRRAGGPAQIRRPGHHGPGRHRRPASRRSASSSHRSRTGSGRGSTRPSRTRSTAASRTSPRSRSSQSG